MSSVNAAEVAADAYTVYNAYNNYSAGQTSGGPSAIGAATTAINVAGILNSNADEEQKAQAVAEQIGLFVADCYTFGLTSTAVRLCDKYFPGVTKALREFAAEEPVLKAIVSLFDSDKWKTEGNRLGKLIDAGVEIPETLRGAMELTRGRSKEELIDHSLARDFQGMAPDGRWVNNKFAMSRDEADLTPRDIWGFAAFFEKFGNDWLQTFSEEDRFSIAQKALECGAVRERHGTIDITWSPELENAIAALRASR